MLSFAAAGNQVKISVPGISILHLNFDTVLALGFRKTELARTNELAYLLTQENDCNALVLAMSTSLNKLK
jgi:hypothetical protein